MSRFALDPVQVLPALRRHILVDGFHVVADLERSHGSWLRDALGGREILDFYGHFASLPVGHNHPRLVGDADFMAALVRAAVANPANSDLYTPEWGAGVAAFARLACPEPLGRLFFVAGGALAVENALKTAFDWKARKNRAAGRAAPGSRILHFREAFHGRSGYTLSLTNTDPVKTAGFPRFDWPRVANPKLEFPRTEASLARTVAAERAALAACEAAFAAHPDDIAAIIIEPIQGEGGDNHFRGEFLRDLRQLADRREALLIFDEVQTGVGLTGRLWCWQHFDVVPDLLVFGKKTQICGLMAGPRVEEVEGGALATPGRLNSTWGGNLVDLLRGVRYLEIIAEEDLLENAARMGARLLAGLEDLERRHEMVSAARGRGLMTAFALPTAALRDALRRRLWARGLATLASWPRSVRFRPCLNVGADEVDLALAMLDDALGELARSARPKDQNDKS